MFVTLVNVEAPCEEGQRYFPSLNVVRVKV